MSNTTKTEKFYPMETWLEQHCQKIQSQTAIKKYIGKHHTHYTKYMMPDENIAYFFLGNNEQYELLKKIHHETITRENREALLREMKELGIPGKYVHDRETGYQTIILPNRIVSTIDIGREMEAIFKEDDEGFVKLIDLRFKDGRP